MVPNHYWGKILGVVGLGVGLQTIKDKLLAFTRIIMLNVGKLTATDPVEAAAAAALIIVAGA